MIARLTPVADADEVLGRASSAHVRDVDLQFTDVMGGVKTITIPVADLEAAFEHGVWFDGSSVEAVARTAESDMYLVPDPSTFRLLPWGGGTTARLVCEAHTPDGEPYAGDPRGALRRAVEAGRALGFEYHCGPEVEFFLLRRDAAGGLAPLPHDRGGYFDVGIDESVGVRQAMTEALRSLEIPVNTAHHEVAPGQHEIDLGAAPALRSADDLVTFRYALKAVAQQAGLVATFMPKPFVDLNGSGLHVHQSLLAVDGANAFADPRDEYALSEVAKHFIAGQLHHAAGMCAVLSPLINSYKRLVRGFEAPVMMSWARTNRAALIRVPHTARPETTRVELRSPDPTCNPYLAYAVMLRCGLDGIERRLPLPPPVEESLYGFDDVELERRNVGLLPDNLKDAVEALRHDQVVVDALGDHLAERFVEAKQLEYRDYRRQVTPWELERYLELA